MVNFCKTSFTFELSRKSSNLEMDIHFVNGKFCKTSFTFELSRKSSNLEMDIHFVNGKFCKLF